MAMTRRDLRDWAVGFLPAVVAVHWRERLRAGFGALCGIGLTGGLMLWMLGPQGYIPWLVAPMGASAVLLFGVPASPLAQPWSILGGNLVAAVVGVTCATYIASPVVAAAAAVGVAIALMFTVRCVHPPSGAVALTAVLGGPAVHALGYGFVLEPIAVQSVVLLGAVNWRLLRPSLGDVGAAYRLRRSAVAELVMGAIVLAVTAVLVATPPPTDAMAQAPGAGAAAAAAP